MKQQGLSSRTTAMCLGFVRSVLARAMSDGLIGVNPAAAVRAHDGDPGKRVPLTLDEAKRVTEQARAHRLVAAWLLTLSGLRRSEVLGLQWQDFDVESKVLSVRRSRVAVGKVDAIGSTKTRAGRRDLPLPDDLHTALKGWRSTIASELGLQAVSPERFIFVDEFGVPIRAEWYSDEWMRLCHRAGIARRVKLHEARHTSVMAMRAAGLPDRMIAAWHGHSEQVMVNTYDHAELDKEGLAQIGKAMEALREQSETSHREGSV